MLTKVPTYDILYIFAVSNLNYMNMKSVKLSIKESTHMLAPMLAGVLIGILWYVVSGDIIPTYITGITGVVAYVYVVIGVYRESVALGNLNNK